MFVTVNPIYEHFKHQLYDLFRKELKLSDEVAKEFVTMIGDEISAERSELVTKDYLKIETTLLRKEIGEMKVDLIIWMFAFWVGQIAILGGVLIYFLK